jgi:hypothetical protein
MVAGPRGTVRSPASVFTGLMIVLYWTVVICWTMVRTPWSRSIPDPARRRPTRHRRRRHRHHGRPDRDLATVPPAAAAPNRPATHRADPPARPHPRRRRASTRPHPHRRHLTPRPRRTTPRRPLPPAPRPHHPTRETGAGGSIPRRHRRLTGQPPDRSQPLPSTQRLYS